MKKFKIISYFKSNIISEGPSYRQSYDGKTEIYKKIADMFIEMTQIYSDIHGYDFKFNFIKDDDLKPIIENKNKFQCLKNNTDEGEIFENTVLYKILMTRDELEKNDSEFVVFFDCDAIVSNPNIKLETFIDNKHEMFVSPGNNEHHYRNSLNVLSKEIQLFFNDKECLEYALYDFKKLNECFKSKYQGLDLNQLFKNMVGCFSTFNEGFFIVKNTDKMKDLFNVMCENFYLSYMRDKFLNVRFSGDGYIISYFLNSLNFYSLYTYMPSWSQGHIMCPFGAHYDVDKSFLMHNYSIMSLEDRLKYFEELKNNKWWKPILHRDIKQ